MNNNEYIKEKSQKRLLFLLSHKTFTFIMPYGIVLMRIRITKKLEMYCVKTLLNRLFLLIYGSFCGIMCIEKRKGVVIMAFRVITNDLQKSYETACIQNNVKDTTPLICGYYGRACRRMNDVDGADRVLCRQCPLPSFTITAKKKNVRYTIKSTSSEGVYFLVNGWNKHMAFWVKENKLSNDMLFLSAKNAKCSLTKLLKIMPEYKNDSFELVEFEGGSENE